MVIIFEKKINLIFVEIATELWSNQVGTSLLVQFAIEQVGLISRSFMHVFGPFRVVLDNLE